MGETGVTRLLIFQKSGTAGTHVRTAPVIIMANDMSVVQLDTSEYTGNFVLSDSQIDHCHLWRGMFENHRQQNQGFGCTSHQFVNVPAESFAEGVAGNPFDWQPIFYPQIFQGVVDVL